MGALSSRDQGKTVGVRLKTSLGEWIKRESGERDSGPGGGGGGDSRGMLMY